VNKKKRRALIKEIKLEEENNLQQEFSIKMHN